jgi:hypothetical protein
VGIHPSQVVIIRIKLDQDCKKILERKRANIRRKQIEKMPE